ncbi:MAG: metallophosphoesterase [Syntrophobacteraceae bacterium]
MTLFVLTFLSLYSLMHAFFYSRARVLLPKGRAFHLGFILFLALMVFAPVATRLLEKSDHYTLARIVAHIGYPWFGYLFYTFLLFLLVGIVGVVFRLVNLAAGTELPVFTGRKTALCVLLVSLAIIVYGIFEARSLRVERLTFRTAKLPEGIERVRIAQISDIHLGLLVGEGSIEPILDRVKAEAPDILVSTGDLVDGDMDRLGRLPALFGEVNPRFGKWAVTGNHEVYVGLADSIKAEREFGFTVLRGEARVVADVINIVGVDDPAAGAPVDERLLLEKARNGLFTLFLKHRPDAARESMGLYDLQLSGHTHYGQLFPFRLFSEYIYPLQNGPYFLEKGSILYTSRGSATWGPPCRVLAPPEITIIDIVRE